MLQIFFYGMASLLLPAIIINAKEPAMDYSQLVPPTATTILTPFPPAPAPAASIGYSVSPQDINYLVAPPPLSSKLESLFDYILPTKSSITSLFSLSYYHHHRSQRSSPRHSTTTSYRQQENEEKPYKSRYSPPATASPEEYDMYGIRQNIIHNRSCSSKVQTEQSQQQPLDQQQRQEDQFHPHGPSNFRMPIQHVALPAKP
ncbi:hypothetical protein FBU30_007068 [Linnemannia zychae]|nr:hypothetical protein FBU30_007068 [Linnemannia zychae]